MVYLHIVVHIYTMGFLDLCAHRAKFVKAKKKYFCDHQQKTATTMQPFSWEQHLVQARGTRQVVFFLDYDGTLTPIVKVPSEAHLAASMRTVVEHLANKFKVAIISGRNKKDVQELIQLPHAPLYFAGSHGFDMSGPNNFSMQIAKSHVPELNACYASLIAQLSVDAYPGVLVENNIYSLSVHYRNCNKQDQDSVISRTSAITSKFKNLHITQGKMVVEVRIKFDWHKGKAVQHLLQNVWHYNSNTMFPVYIGDDKTDEDAFEVVCNEFAGLSILVSNDYDSKKASHATCHVASPKDVECLLNKFL